MNPETHFDLQPTGEAPFREHPFDREPSLLGEDAFQQVLALEKKRSERSGAPVLLMLLNVQDVPGGREWKPLVATLSATLFSVTRETDIKGWYADQAILGVLCTEIGDAGLDEARDIILGKVTEHLRNLLSGEQMRKLRFTFASFTGKDQQPLSGTMQADIRLYRKSAATGASTAAGTPFAASFLRHWGILVVGDILAIGLACFLTAWIRTGIPFNIFEAYTGACLATLCQFLIGLFIFDQYRTRRLFREREMLTGTGLAVGLGTLLSAAFFYLAPQWQFGRGTLAIQASLAWILLAGFRLVYSRLIAASEPRTPTLVLGNGQLGKQVIQLLSSPVSPFDVKGCLVDGDLETLGEIGSPPMVGSLDQLGEAAKDLGIKTIVIALPRHRSQRIIRKVLEARLNGIEIIDLPNLYERLAGRIPVQYIEDHWLLFADGFTLISKTTVQKLKRLVDLVFSSLLLIVLFPIAALIALAILVDSPGPVFYREERVGRTAACFPCGGSGPWTPRQSPKWLARPCKEAPGKRGSAAGSAFSGWTTCP